MDRGRMALIRVEVAQTGAAVSILHPDGRRMAVCSTPPELAQLGKHWQATGAAVAPGLAILDLKHASGMQAEWFLDDAAMLLPDDPDLWPPETQAALRDAVVTALCGLRDALLPSNGGLPGPDLPVLQRLRPSLLKRLVHRFHNAVLPLAHHPLEQAGPPPALPALRDAVHQDLQEQVMAALRGDGLLRWPSPASGELVPCTGGFFLDDFRCIYRFHDAAHGLDFLVLTTEHMARLAGLLVAGQVFTLGHDQARMLAVHFPPPAADLLLPLLTHADDLQGRHQPGRVTAFLRCGSSAHIGHQLWNELSAIDVLLRDLPVDRLPCWIVPGDGSGSGIEFYGPLDALFPELLGRVVRGLPDHPSVIRYAYREGLCLVRITREWISAGLRRRVAGLAALPPAPDAAAPLVVLLGLRVENRTVNDLAAFCAWVIEEVMRARPGGTVVLDGHNARAPGAGVITSYREGEAARAPLDIERDLAAAMRVRFAGQDIRILDTLGRPLVDSLRWSAACHGFVALWGAGLAKYRWVANRPGLIVTNRWNLERKGDLRIYDEARYMEAPSPVAFLPAALVRDTPGTAMLIPFAEPTYGNFDLDEAGVRAEIRGLLAAVGSADGLSAKSPESHAWHGSVDRVGTRVQGWAIGPGAGTVILDILIDGALAGTASCTMDRPDLLRAGFPTGRAGFDAPIPAAFLSGRAHDVQVRFPGGPALRVLTPNGPDPHTFRIGG